MSVRLTNRGRKAFIVKPESVLQGGELSADKQFMYINPEETVEVTEECAKVLAGHSEIKVLDSLKKKGK